jgi:hypothetical protein
MIVNLVNLKVNFHESGSIELRFQTKEMIEDKNYYYSEVPTSVYISKDSIPYFIDCLTGKSNFYPWFDDINYLVKPHCDGMSFLDKSNPNKVMEWTIYFPFKLWKRLIKELKQFNKSSFNGFIELTPDELDSFAKDVYPKVKWNYHHRTDGKWIDFKWNEWITKNVIDSLYKWSNIYPDLLKDLDRLENIAKSYSVFGELIEIDISFDSYNTNEGTPDSFYFYIHVTVNGEDKRIMNGGLIAHYDERKNEYHYSMHT